MWFGIAFYFFCIGGLVTSYACVLIMIRKRGKYTVSCKSITENRRQATITALITITTCTILNLTPSLDIVLQLTGFWDSSLCVMAYFSLLLNCVVNPWIYCYRTPLLKKHIKRFITCKRYHQDPECINGVEECSLSGIEDESLV